MRSGPKTLAKMQAIDSNGSAAMALLMIYGIGIILAGLLLALSVIDLKTYRLPNPLTLALVISGLIFAYWWKGDLLNHLIGAVAGYSVFVAIELVYKQLRGKDGLGRGDAKLLAGAGAWCGWMGLPFIVLIGSGMGLVAALFPSFRKAERVPFGPFLALGIMIVWTALNLGDVSL